MIIACIMQDVMMKILRIKCFLDKESVVGFTHQILNKLFGVR